MEQEMIQKSREQDEKLDKILKSVETTRKYFLWTLIVAAVTVVVPIVGLAMMIPQFLSIYGQTMGF